VTNHGPGLAWVWPPALSIRARAVVLFLVIMLATAGLGASLSGAHPLSAISGVVDVLCALILIAAWMWVESEVVRPSKAMAEIAWGFTHGSVEPRPVGRPKDGTGISLWDCVDTFAGVLQAQSHSVDDAVAVERIVLREVNHRIRNNLQMVASILAIQARADEADSAPRAGDRINVLSLAHDRINAAGDVRDVRLDDLAAEIGRALLSARGAQARRVRLELALSPARVTSETAVPMAFLMGEGLSHALDVLGPAGDVVLVMTLHTEAGGAILFSLSSNEAPGARQVLPNTKRLTDAFALQLGAEIAHPRSGPEIVRVRLAPGAAITAS